MAAADGPDGDAVLAFFRANVVPRRHREPRLVDAFRDVEMQTVETRWGAIACWRLGDGPAVLLVHGFEDDSSLWSPLVDALAATGTAVVALDLPAHGYSGGEWGLGWEAADAIHAVASALGPIDAVVAHSFGCGAAAGAISEGLGVARAVLVAPPLRSTDRWQRYGERLGVGDDVVAAARRIYEDAIGRERTAWRARDVLPALDVEMLVVHSRDDERNPFEDSTEIVPTCRRAQLLAVDGLTHRRTARDPHVIDAIVEFLGARA